VIVDTSALIAILRHEPEAEAFTDILLSGEQARISTGTLLESQMVAMAYRCSRELTELLHLADIEVLPFDGPQAALAQEGFRRFGKRRHPAGLNFGDCFAYAAAKATGEPLLFKGKDFDQTDVATADNRQGGG
jgi:ribonuclease VapC